MEDETHPMRELGRRLEETRRRGGLSFREAADRTGMSRNSLHYLMRHRVTAPDYYETKALVERLGGTWDAAWEQLWRRAAAGDARPADPAPDPSGNRLPPDVGGFLGRGTELSELDRRSAEAAAGATPVVAVVGTAGVGKTALAVHWAHRAAGRFPGGVLCVDLHGYAPENRLTPAEVLPRLLRSLAVAPGDVPAEVEEAVDLYRARLAARTLVVLDNADSAEQVRPLLPGAPGCMAVVTSREALPGLVSRDGAIRLELEPLPPAAARRLLGRLAGAPAGADPAATDELVRLCAGLPLALRIVAEWVAARPDVPAAEVVAALSDERRQLELLDAGGDPRTAVDAVFSWSYRQLPADAARAFRLLSRAPGPDVGLSGVAVLLDVPPDAAGRVLRRLVAAHLVQRTGANRYAQHDLLRAYGRRLPAEPAADRAAIGRLVDSYLAGVRAGAAGWLRDEDAALVGACGVALEHGLPERATELARALYAHLAGVDRTADASVVHRHAVRAAERLGDPGVLATALVDLGATCHRQGRLDEAIPHYRRAVDAIAGSGRAGLDAIEGRAVSNLGAALARTGDTAGAVRHLSRAVQLLDTAGNGRSLCMALTNLGTLTARSGQVPAALAHLGRALALARDLGDELTEAEALTDIGDAHLRTPDLPAATEAFAAGRRLARAIPTRFVESCAVHGLGEVARLEGRHHAALDLFRQALGIAREIGDPYIEACALNGEGEALAATGDHAAALRSHRASLAIAARAGDRYEQARCHAGIGSALVELGEGPAALDQWADAVRLYATSAPAEARVIEDRISAFAGRGGAPVG